MDQDEQQQEKSLKSLNKNCRECSNDRSLVQPSGIANKSEILALENQGVVSHPSSNQILIECDAARLIVKAHSSKRSSVKQDFVPVLDNLGFMANNIDSESLGQAKVAHYSNSASHQNGRDNELVLQSGFNFLDSFD